MKRGEIWMADFGPPTGPEQAGVRPAIILQDDTLSQGLSTTIVVPLTTKTKRLSIETTLFIPAIETTLFIPAGEGGLPQDSVVLCHQVQVRGKVRLLSQIGVLSQARLAEVEDGEGARLIASVVGPPLCAVFFSPHDNSAKPRDSLPAFPPVRPRPCGTVRVSEN